MVKVYKGIAGMKCDHQFPLWIVLWCVTFCTMPSLLASAKMFSLSTLLLLLQLFTINLRTAGSHLLAPLLELEHIIVHHTLIKYHF